MIRDRQRGQRGFTLVELMVGMVLSTILIGMVFALFLQMSAAFRTQSQVSELQQNLVAAQSLVLRDLRQAGYQVPNGFTVAYDADFHQAIEIVNADDGPDELHVAYGDPSAQARVDAFIGTGAVNVDDVDRFVLGDLAVVTAPIAPDPDVNPVPPQVFVACVVAIADISGNTLTFDTVAPWGSADNIHCLGVANRTIAPSSTMIYRFKMRGYRIDADRKTLSVLQRSESAGVADDWEDFGIGFTDLQVATRWFDGDGIDTDDPDVDPDRDWYSGDDQAVLTAPTVAAPVIFPNEITVSFVVRSTRKVEGVVSDATPSLTDTDNVDNNPVGDRAAITLAGVADSVRAEEHRGDHVYRWSTTRVDLRNLGVGL